MSNLQLFSEGMCSGFGTPAVSGTLDFPQSLTEKYRPGTIDAFAGLDKPKRILAKFAAAPYPASWLFVGPPGTGKTTMGLALAAELRAEVHHHPKPTVQCRSRRR